MNPIKWQSKLLKNFTILFNLGKKLKFDIKKLQSKDKKIFILGNAKFADFHHLGVIAEGWISMMYDK